MYCAEDAASNTAALLELSYRTTTQFGTTLYELSIQEQQQRNAQIQMLLGYIALQGAMGSVQQYNAAGGAIRYPGATNAAPGYESVPSDFGSFNLPSNGNAGNGSTSLTNGARLTTNAALDAADDFLGAGYKEVAPGVFRSKDGLRQVRMTDSDISGAHGGGAHMNFETGKSISNPNGRLTFKVTDNMHIYLTD